MDKVKKNKQSTLHLYRGRLQSEVQPIVVQYKAGKKKKKTLKAQKGTGEEDFQRIEGNLLRITKRSTNALSKGLGAYEKARNLSIKEKTESAFEEFVDDSAKAASISMKEVSEIPMDIAESLHIKPYQKRIRKNLRRASKIIRLFRI
jgi:hypothetical protein